MKSVLIDLLKRNEITSVSLRKLKYLLYKYCIPDVYLVRYIFKKRLNRKVNLENPINYNDKIQWLKLNWRDSLAVKCADKYEVREFVKEKIGEDYLNQLYGVYETVEDLDIDSLPESFVLKGTHGSGFNIICDYKRDMDWNTQLNKMKKWLKKNYYWQNREWVYKDIKPRIICEGFLKDEKGEELKDYRFFCFNGEPKFIAVDYNITEKLKTRRNLYDLSWNLMEGEISYPKELSKRLVKPNKLNEMIELSKVLSEGFPHVRVDFYYINEKIYFGEMTFFHQSGLGKIKPESFETTMGQWLSLPQKSSIDKK